MSAYFRPRQGGKIRWALVSPSDETWDNGTPVMLTNVSGVATWAKYDGTQNVLVGVATENVVESNALQTAHAVVQGKEASAIIDPTVVETSLIATGVTFLPGEGVYANSDAEYTNDAGSSDTAFLGYCLKGNAANADAKGATTITFAYQPDDWRS